MAELYEKEVVNGSNDISNFYKETVTKLIPGYSRGAFYKMVNRYGGRGLRPISFIRDASGAITAFELTEAKPGDADLSPSITAPASSGPVFDPARSTSRGIEAALAIGTRALEEMLTDTDALAKMTPKDRAELLFKAMRAQDARVNVAINARREVRAHKAFQHAFDEAAYQVEDMVAQDALPMEQQ